MNKTNIICKLIAITILTLLIININGYCIERYKAFMSNDYEILSSELNNNVKKGICHIPFSFICNWNMI